MKANEYTLIFDHFPSHQEVKERLGMPKMAMITHYDAHENSNNSSKREVVVTVKVCFD